MTTHLHVVGEPDWFADEAREAADALTRDFAGADKIPGQVRSGSSGGSGDTADRGVQSPQPPTRSVGSGSSAPQEPGGTAGEQILDDVVALLTRHVAFPSPHHPIVVACWVAHTHLLEAFDTTPRLAVLLPEKGSGKTRVLEVIEPLLPAADMLITPSASVLFRLIDDQPNYTLLLDECDAYLGNKQLSAEQEQVRAIVNSGYRRGAAIPRTEVNGKTFTPKKFSVFCPVALAGIGDLPETILDRSVIIAMKRRRTEDQVTPWRDRMKVTVAPLRTSLEAWGKGEVKNAVELDADPHFLPDHVEDRLADVWGPLIVTAAVVGPRWHRLMVDACEALMTTTTARAASLGVRLLGDVQRVFLWEGVHQITTDLLLSHLHKLEDAPWGDLRGAAIDPRFLARKLATYDVYPRPLNLGDASRPRGYSLRDNADGTGGLADAFARYLPRASPSPPEGGATCATPATADQEAHT